MFNPSPHPPLTPLSFLVSASIFSIHLHCTHCFRSVYVIMISLSCWETETRCMEGTHTHTDTLLLSTSHTPGPGNHPCPIYHTFPSMLLTTTMTKHCSSSLSLPKGPDQAVVPWCSGPFLVTPACCHASLCSSARIWGGGDNTLFTLS